MTTVWLALRADVRRRWPALLSLALLLGLIGGVVLTAAAGARRTDTAYPRLLSWANASQVDIVPENTGFTGYYPALARLPHIAAMTTVSIYNVVLSPRNPGMVSLMSSPDGAMGVSVDRVKILAGRLYDPKAPGQAMVDQQLASTEHLTPGSTLSLYGVPSTPSGVPEYDKAVTLTFRVTGIVVFDDEIVPTGTNNALPTALVSSPFAATTAAASLSAGDEAAVRLQPGASQTAFTSAAETLARRYPGTGGTSSPCHCRTRSTPPSGLSGRRPSRSPSSPGSPGSSPSPSSASCSAASSRSTRLSSLSCGRSACSGPRWSPCRWPGWGS